MKKTCMDCWYGGKGRKTKNIIIACQKLNTNVRSCPDRSNCKHFCTYPQERREMGRISYSSILGGFNGQYL